MRYMERNFEMKGSGKYQGRYYLAMVMIEKTGEITRMTMKHGHPLEAEKNSDLGFKVLSFQEISEDEYLIIAGPTQIKV